MITPVFKDFKSHILLELDKAEETILVAVYWFTHKELFNKLCEKLENDVSVSLVIFNDLTNNGIRRLDFQRFIDLKGKFYFSSFTNPMHHKYCVIDVKVLINGSYNWTYNAEGINKENIIIIKNHAEVINAFTENFQSLISELKEVEKVNDYISIDTDLEEYKFLKNQLAQDALVEATETGNNEVLKEMLSISPDIEEYQQKMVELGLVARKKIRQSIGIEVDDKEFSVCLAKGLEVPCTTKRTYITKEDNQENVTCKMFYGESEYSPQNHPFEFKKNGSLTNVLKVSSLPLKLAGEVSCMLESSMDIYGNFSMKLYNHSGHLADSISLMRKNFLDNV
ncbi:phospholipase D-like domain-containing protein [Autumnicola psychrophila]|uniref:phospholipase D n=1 Tax=Autumnicola psychrophila TaxID=3075592 RepID=A0ABU3DR61_9FLAO|nr:phospholipase D-like domain-containing protein [Zunongwangia sp. F225]MDT0685572.1 phospholipase D-like domain-containing protein [Zunongwangia sp. F225]